MACLNPHDPQTARIYDTDGAFHSVMANSGAGMARDGVFVIRKRRFPPSGGETAARGGVCELGLSPSPPLGFADCGIH